MEGDILLSTFIAGMFAAFLISTLVTILSEVLTRCREEALESAQSCLGLVTVLLLFMVIANLIF